MMKLEDINKDKEPFKVPDGYFEQLYTDVLNKKSDAEQTSSWILFRKPALAISIFGLVGVIAGSLWYFNSQNQKDCGSLACLDKEQLLNEAIHYDISSVIEYTADSTKTDTTTVSSFLHEIDETELLNEL